jgi:MFS superfamily sulfate permease-like transporter
VAWGRGPGGGGGGGPPLAAVAAGIAVALAAGALGVPGAETLPRITLPPGGLAGAFAPPDPAAVLSWPAVLGAALALGLVASVESLLTAAAADRMQSFAPRTDYNRELLAQGAANLVAGGLGGLPVSGVIVRTGANIHAGARTRWSSVLHGVWMVVALAAIPFALEEVPLAALAALLVLTGVKLASPAQALALWRARRSDAAIYGLTAVAIVATDLLTGIGAGFAAALFRLGWDVFRVHIDHHEADGTHRLSLRGIATFLHLPRLARALERVPPDAPVHVDIAGLHYMDEGVRDHIERWREERRAPPLSAALERREGGGPREQGSSAARSG